MSSKHDEVIVLISTCRLENDMDCKISLFNLIKQIVSDRTGEKIETPSLLTDDYINTALDRISY
jgi:hypothetical protein